MTVSLSCAFHRLLMLRNVDELAAIEVGTLEREEQLAGVDRAGIRADTTEGSVTTGQLALHEVGSLNERAFYHHDPAPAAARFDRFASATS